MRLIENTVRFVRLIHMCTNKLNFFTRSCILFVSHIVYHNHAFLSPNTHPLRIEVKDILSAFGFANIFLVFMQVMSAQKKMLFLQHIHLKLFFIACLRKYYHLLFGKVSWFLVPIIAFTSMMKKKKSDLTTSHPSREITMQTIVWM